MLQIIEQSHEEKVAMYMKCSKIKLVEMLIECNKHLDALSSTQGTTAYVFKKPKRNKSNKKEDSFFTSWEKAIKQIKF